ncbi:hypothetical protein B0T20DRAFT_361285 [Sordaria brevicollis]|uniref:Uncharacterized protein n=1 Tax=Sordaria brevicollis TaxID=83679 RepID=A0AAE0P2I2_SORBR|nr:hypothetical protein B0T20DRAFT_361285 [Sordaria brevicollis]
MGGPDWRRHGGVQMTYKPLSDRLQALLYEAPQVCYTNLVPPARRDPTLGTVKCGTGVFGMCTRYSCSNDWCNIVEASDAYLLPSERVHVAWYCIRRRRRSALNTAVPA